jgi:ankyrin repeat protein
MQMKICQSLQKLPKNSKVRYTKTIKRALDSCNIKIIELFLKHGAKIDAKFAKYEFAYSRVISQCNIEAVKLFIKYGLDVDAISKNYKRKVKRYFESGRNYILCKSKSRFLELGKLIKGW